MRSLELVHDQWYVPEVGRSCRSKTQAETASSDIYRTDEVKKKRKKRKNAGGESWERGSESH